MSPDRTTTSWLRHRIGQGPLLVAPGAANALSARVIEDVGFEVVYVSGAGIANTYYGSPDIGLVTLTEVVSHVSAIRDAVALPLIVDADTGFGNAVGVSHAMRLLERAGADAIQLEDQESPKRCGHFEGKRIISRSEMIQKVHAAVDSRNNHVVVIARTDARAVEGLDSAIDRANSYIEAGADVAFVEAPQSIEEVRSLLVRIDAPQAINLVEGGQTPTPTAEQLAQFRIALFANIALQGAAYGMKAVLEELKIHQAITPKIESMVVGWSERQRLVRKPLFDELEQRYASGGSPP
jgi:2-methylisocitrate lyase-like PEP mutase family enzyme